MLHKYLYYLWRWAKVICTGKNYVIRKIYYTLSSTIYQGNGIEESIFQSRKAFAANSSLVGHKKSIAYSLLIRSSQYRRIALVQWAIKKFSPRSSTPSDISFLYTRLWVSIEMSIVDKRTWLRGGKAARKKNDLTWQKKRGRILSSRQYVTSFLVFFLRLKWGSVSGERHREILINFRVGGQSRRNLRVFMRIKDFLLCYLR